MILTFLTDLFFRIIQNKYIVGLILLLTVFGSCYGYYQHSQREIERLNNEKILLVQHVNGLVQQNDMLQQNLKEISLAKETLTAQIVESEKEKKVLQDTLTRLGKKPLDELASKKSSLVEKKINDGTEKVTKCFESISRGEACK